MTSYCHTIAERRDVHIVHVQYSSLFTGNELFKSSQACLILD